MAIQSPSKNNANSLGCAKMFRFSRGGVASVSRDFVPLPQAVCFVSLAELGCIAYRRASQRKASLSLYTYISHLVLDKTVHGHQVQMLCASVFKNVSRVTDVSPWGEANLTMLKSTVQPKVKPIGPLPLHPQGFVPDHCKVAGEPPTLEKKKRHLLRLT